mgnify:CR=1 FL=1
MKSIACVSISILFMLVACSTTRSKETASIKGPTVFVLSEVLKDKGVPLGGSYARGIEIFKNSDPTAEAELVYKKYGPRYLNSYGGFYLKDLFFHIKIAKVILENPVNKVVSIPGFSDAIGSQEYTDSAHSFAKKFNKRMVLLAEGIDIDAPAYHWDNFCLRKFNRVSRLVPFTKCTPIDGGTGVATSWDGFYCSYKKKSAEENCLPGTKLKVNNSDSFSCESEKFPLTRICHDREILNHIPYGDDFFQTTCKEEIQKEDDLLSRYVAELKKDTPKKLKKSILEHSRSSLIDLHMSYGLWMRNEKLRKPAWKPMIDFYEQIGITHLDDISAELTELVWESLVAELSPVERKKIEEKPEKYMCEE